METSYDLKEQRCTKTLHPDILAKLKAVPKLFRKISPDLGLAAADRIPLILLGRFFATIKGLFF